MTSPTGAPSTTPWPLTPGAPAVRITDGANNSPAGLLLVNPGTNGQTIYIATGPGVQTGAVPLGPGAAMSWTDTATMPYAYVTGVKGETLVVTSQADSYSNPSTVAASLIQQGIPSTMVDTGYGTYRLNVGVSAAPILVGLSSTLTIEAAWNQPTPVGANVLRVRFDDPDVPTLDPIDYFLTVNNAAEQAANVWQVPVAAPRLTLTNLTTPDNNNSPADVSVVGNNRPGPAGQRILGGRGVKTLMTLIPAVGRSAVLQGCKGDPFLGGGTSNGTGPMTRFSGPVTVAATMGSTSTETAGLVAYWIDETGNLTGQYLMNWGGGSPPNTQIIQWNHPPVPVYYEINVGGTVTANNYVHLTVSGAQ